MAAPLSIGLGLVFSASVGSMFFSPTTKIGLSLYSLSVYGGIVLFSMLLLYDTQRIVQKSETSLYFDPVNESISIYLNALNIFTRFALILSSGHRRR
jgi:FtsH-binding integral membrane protein